MTQSRLSVDHQVLLICYSNWLRWYQGAPVCMQTCWPQDIWSIKKNLKTRAKNGNAARPGPLQITLVCNYVGCSQEAHLQSKACFKIQARAFPRIHVTGYRGENTPKDQTDSRFSVWAWRNCYLWSPVRFQWRVILPFNWGPIAARGAPTIPRIVRGPNIV